MLWGGYYFCNGKHGEKTPYVTECGLDKCKGHRRFTSHEQMAGDDRWLGALSKEASKEFDNVGDAIREFERLTKQNASDEGCNCCGPPHGFEWDGDSCSGESCLEHLFDNVPSSLREATELLNT